MMSLLARKHIISVACANAKFDTVTRAHVIEFDRERISNLYTHPYRFPLSIFLLVSLLFH